MSLWQQLADAIFTGDREWAWRRRLALSAGAANISGILNSTFWDHDQAHATMVMSNCQTGLLAVLTIYVAAAVTDDQLRRKNKPGEDSVNAKP